MSTTEDIRAIGIFVDALRLGDKQVYTYAQKALTRLLPQIDCNSAKYLSLEQRGVLIQMLGFQGLMARNMSSVAFGGEDALIDLQIEILRSFEYIGDETVISAIEKLILCTLNKNVRIQALKTKDYLQQKFSDNINSHLLLRVPADENVCSNYLLHPSIGIPPSEPSNVEEQNMN